MKKGVIGLLVLGMFLVLAGAVYSSHFISASSNVCCEKLTQDAGGAWCQNAPQSSCDLGINSQTGQNYQWAPTSCASTPFCKTGTCYDSQQGTCESDVSETVCQSDGGVWDSRLASELPQCQLGCCLLGDGASFVTQSRCKQLSSLYGQETSFNPGIKSEIQCIASAGGDEKGACTYEKTSERTCQLLTKTDCNKLKGDASKSNVIFHEGLLCSDETLGTNCGPSQKTTRVNGQDEVYFVDTCGNLANIYDSSKIKDKTYWSKIVAKEDSCGAGKSNVDSPTCGNCDYYRGSTAVEYKRGDSVKPTYGDYYCKDLGCDFDGVKYQHGESWCGVAPGTAKITDANGNGTYTFENGAASPDITKTNLPGSTYERYSCYNGEVTVDNCYDGRQKVCVESNVPTSDGKVFKNAACELNTWQSCYDQTNETSCLNREVRDCKWVPSANDKKTFLGCSNLGNKIGTGVVTEITNAIQSASCLFYYNEPLGKSKTAFKTPGQTGYCVPINSPGFDFWNGTGNGDNLCSLGTIGCQYRTTSNFFGSGVGDGAECINSDNSVKQNWVKSMTYRCMQIGDCGPKLNYLGQPGEMQTIVEKKLGDNQAVGYYVKTDGKTVEAPGIKTNFKSFFGF